MATERGLLLEAWRFGMQGVPGCRDCRGAVRECGKASNRGLSLDGWSWGSPGVGFAGSWFAMPRAWQANKVWGDFFFFFVLQQCETTSITFLTQPRGGIEKSRTEMTTRISIADRRRQGDRELAGKDYSGNLIHRVRRRIPLGASCKHESCQAPIDAKHLDYAPMAIQQAERRVTDFRGVGESAFPCLS